MPDLLSFWSVACNTSPATSTACAHRPSIAIQDTWTLTDTTSWARVAAQPLEKGDMQRMQQSTAPSYLHQPASADCYQASSAHTLPETVQRHANGATALAASHMAPHKLESALRAKGTSGNSTAAWESVQSLLGKCATSPLIPDPFLDVAASHHVLVSVRTYLVCCSGMMHAVYNCSMGVLFPLIFTIVA